MKAPLRLLKKQELVWLATHRCQHKHTYLEHYNCFKIKQEDKILFIDIETTPALGWVWGKYDQTVIRFEKDWYILCVGFKWAGGKTEVLIGDERKLIRKVRDLLNEADLVVAHN